MNLRLIKTNEQIPRHDLEIFEDRTIPFEAGRIENYDQSSRASYPHRHTFYEIHMIRSGKGIHHIDDHNYEIESGAVYLLSPEQIQHWTLHSPLEGFVMIFKEDFLHHASSGVSVLDDLSFFHQPDRDNFFRPTPQETQHLTGLFETITNEMKERRVGWENVVRAMAHVFLIEIQRSLQKEQANIPTGRNLSLARKFRRLIDHFACEERQLPFYSKKLNVSGGHLHTVVKEVFDFSPGQMIQQALVREAKRRLSYTDVSIAEISYALNFDDPSYFSRLFKKSVGQSPKSYREENAFPK